ncbi:hypothetical protein JTB14_000451 [Gonioctena quinquepunctata]|nr:hypothetical protein JTB14_000451 [Gonioctena quinquepunctata]
MSFVSFSNLLNYEENLEQNTQSQNMVDAKANTAVTVAEIHVKASTNEKSIVETGVETVAITNPQKRIQDQTDFNLISIFDDAANGESIEETVAICNPQKGVGPDQLQSDEITPNGLQLHCDLGTDLDSKINNSLGTTVVHQTSDLLTRESDRENVLDKSDSTCFPTKQTDRSPLVPIQLVIDPFDKHLKFPDSKTETKKKNVLIH